MIKNERQHRITKAQADRFENDLRAFDADASSNSHIHPLLFKAQRDALVSQLQDLREELSEYEQLREGKSRVFSGISLESLPQTLIQARIAAGWSQKDLGDHLGMKEQQIQRYEASEYTTASLDRLREVASVLGVELSGDVFIPGTELSSQLLMRRFESMGFDREFVLKRLLPPNIAYCLDTKTSGVACTMQAAAMVKRVFEVEPSIFLGPDPLSLDSAFAKTARFKVGANANEKRLGAYVFYAHYLAMLVLDATQHLPTRFIPSDPLQVNKEIVASYGGMNLKGVLNYMWDHGIPVIPLHDKGAFHGACWRVDGRNVVVLKQLTSSCDRWMFDALHEFRHCNQHVENLNWTVVEAKETSPERRESDDEKDASAFAGNVVLGGLAESLTSECVRTAKGSVEALKSVVPSVARNHGVSVGSLANYVAFRLSLQKQNWWGAAQNLQEEEGDPWQIALDILMARIDWSRLNNVDRSMLQNGLQKGEGLTV